MFNLNKNTFVKLMYLLISNAFTLCCIAFICLLSEPVYALGNTDAVQALLPVDKAFSVSVTPINNLNTVQVQWKIAPDYHLYRDRIHILAQSNSGYKLGKYVLPAGIPQYDDVLGNYMVYDKSFNVNIPLIKLNSMPLVIKVNYQGCKGLLYCYPPETKVLKIDLNNVVKVEKYTGNVLDKSYQQNIFARVFKNDNYFWIMISFFGFGILLSFTPCVLPMIPILSSIIIGQKKSSLIHSFGLSLVYVLSAAITFAMAGCISVMAGYSVQAFLQNKWVVSAVALLFILLALSLFGLFELKLPLFLRDKINNLLNKQSGGTYAGTAMMGALSSVVVSPCISAPLIGALIYISTTGNMVLGGLTLFSLGIGMGLPLLVIGTLGGRLLVKSGSWMYIIKFFFGIIMILMALWLMLPLVKKSPTSNFTTVYNMTQVSQQLNIAKTQHKPVVIDFYADWCVACKELDVRTFSNPLVKEKLKNFIILRADVTKNGFKAREMQSHFSVLAPPTIVFIDGTGVVYGSATLFGFVSPKTILLSLNQVTTGRSDIRVNT